MGTKRQLWRRNTGAGRQLLRGNTGAERQLGRGNTGSERTMKVKGNIVLCERQSCLYIVKKIFRLCP